MAISSNQDITFTVTNVQDGEILVYDASQGTFVNQSSSLSGSSNTSTLARNLGNSGTGIFAQANGEYLEFYKIAAGANTTLSLSGNVITIDAKVGTGNIESQTISLTSTNGNLATFTAPNAAGNANVSGYVQINVDTGYDALSDNIGDSANTRLRFGSDDDMDVELHGDKGVFITTGSDANVSHIKMRSMRNIEFHTGAVDNDSEALQINMDGSLRIADRYTLPNVNGLQGQVLTASGNGNVYWSTMSDLTGYVTTAELEAVDNAAFKLDQDNLPTVTNTYDLGSPTKKFAIMYSTRFAGTADLALSSNSLGGVPAANFALKANVYTKDEVNALIAGVSSNVSSNSSTDGITVAANGESYFSDTLSIVAGNGIDVDLNQTGKILTITNEAFFEGGFRNVKTDGDQSTVIVAENREDTLNFASGNGIVVTNNPVTDTVTFATDDSYFMGLLNTGISGNILPATDATYNLGSPTKRWNELYLSGNSIYIDNQTVSANTSGLYFEGNLLTTKTYVDDAITNATANITNYSNSDVQAYLDAQGYSNVDSDAQTLGLLANVLTISDGNSVDFTSAIATARTGLASAAYVDNAIANIADSDAQTLGLAGNVITISGSNSSVDFTSAIATARTGLASTTYVDNAVANIADSDAQTLSLTGNVITISGSGSSVDLSTLLGSINTDAQSLSLAGNVITISGSGSSVDLTTLLGPFHTAAANLDGYATETFVSNQVTSANTAMKAYVDATIAKDFFLNVKVDGDQTTVITADSDGDTLNFASGDGVTVTSNAGSDTVTFALDLTYLSNLANTSDARLYTYIDLADADLSTEISHANSAMRSYVDGQVGDLYNAIGNISDTDNQTLSLSGNTITISGSNSSVDLTSVLSNVSVDLTGYATELYVNTANSQMKEYVDGLALSGGNVDLSSYVTEAELNASLANISSGSDGADGVSVSSAAISSGNLILTLSDSSTIDAGNVVGPTGPQGDTGPQGPQGNVGPAGSDGADGADGVSISSATVTGSNLIITLSDASTLDAGNVVGPAGPQGDTGATGPQGPQGEPGPAGADGTNGINGSDGADGVDGIGITNTVVTDGSLIITYSNTSVQNLGDVTGPQGATGPQGPQGNVGPAGSDGADGVSVSSATAVSGNLILTLSDSSTIDAGNVVGPVGATGPQGPQGNVGPAGSDGSDGVSVSSAAVTGSNLIITLSDASTIDAGNVVGPQGPKGDTGDTGATGPQGPAGADGADGIQLTDISVTTAAASGNGSLSYNSTTGVFTFAPADLSGVSGTYGNTEVQAYLDAQGYSNVDSDAQTLTLFGNTLSISNGNSVDLSSFAGGGGASAINDLTDVNTAGVSDGQALIYDAGNSEWVAGNVSSGGGSSVTRPAQYERFKVNYNTTGAVDSITDLTGGISGVTIDSASGGDITITFTGYDFPPASIMIYGYNYSANSYNVVPFESTMSLREVPGGGSTGSPTAFGSFTTLKLKVREAETGASRGFGTVTHAYIAFNMMG